MVTRDVPVVNGTSDNSTNDTYVSPADTTPYSFSAHFIGLDYDALMANTTRREAFKLDVRTAVARAAALNISNVDVYNLTRGSVVSMLGRQECRGIGTCRSIASLNSSNLPVLCFAALRCSCWGICVVCSLFRLIW